jgi:hypothetical protein
MVLITEVLAVINCQRKEDFMETLLYIGLIPVTVGGLAMYLKLSENWLRVLGLVMFGGGLLCYLLLPAVLRGVD